LVVIISLPSDPSAERLVHGGLGLGWLAALAAQLYVADAAVHGAEVGAYVPGLLLATAQIPSWAFLVPIALEAMLIGAASFLTRRLSRVLAAISLAVLGAYACLAIAALLYVAFAPYQG
jgi:hypothetical protein